MPLHNAGQLQLELDELMEEPLFHSFIIKDVNRLSEVTKWRWVSAPNKAMRRIHLQIRAALSQISVDMPHATAGAKGSKVVDHVKRHRGNQYICSYDLRSAYDHVQPEVMASVLRRYDVDEKVIGLVLRYCFATDGGLVTGGLVAVQLFNLYLHDQVDTRLAKLFAVRSGITYTRYLDDLIISSEAPIGRRFRRSILQIIREAGFDIQPAKTQLIDLVAEPTGSVILNGIGLRLNGELYVPPRYRELLYRLIKSAEAGEVEPEVMHGCMGAFYAIKPRDSSMTAGEQKVHGAYRWYVHQLRRTDPGRIKRRRHRQQRYRARRRYSRSSRRLGTAR